MPAIRSIAAAVQAVVNKATVCAEVQALIDRGAWFVVNHSGGKDSQAMYDYVCSVVPHEQIVVIHAELPGVEWEGVIDHIRATIRHPLHITRSKRGLLEMIEQRGMFPSPTLRQCTSDLKRGPIEREVRQHGYKLIVNCMGLRAEESSSRAKAQTFKFSARNSKAGREWYDWLPIHSWTVGEVFARIAAAGQQPHWAYGAGMSRLSCCFCIMASTADLTLAAKLNPALFAKYVELEERTGQTMRMPSKRELAEGVRPTLERVTGVKAQRVIPIRVAA
jgi:DNA sulfur modification protein DndC